MVGYLQMLMELYEWFVAMGMKELALIDQNLERQHANRGSGGQAAGLDGG